MSPRCGGICGRSTVRSGCCRSFDKRTLLPSAMVRREVLSAEGICHVIENIDPGEYRDRYLKPAGRDQGVSPIERAVYASRS